MTSILFLIVGFALGGGGAFMAYKAKAKKHQQQLETENANRMAQAQKQLAEIEHKAQVAESKIKEKILEAKNRAFEVIEEAKKEEREIRRQLEKQEARLISKEDVLDKKTSELDQLKENYQQKLEKVKIEEEKVEALYKQEEEKLLTLSQMSKEDAQNRLLERVERDYKPTLVERYKRMEADLKEDAEKNARNVLVQAIQKVASDVTSEATQTLVELPSDEIKGRIIGREGRNINAFEHMTGVDVIVDDTPGAIVMSGFDLMRRYVAKRSLEKLIEDGRIQPARIEAVVEQTKGEVNDMIKEFGEKAAYEMGITGLHPDLIRIVGRLRFRTSYGQNVLKHSIEVGYLAGAIAAELGLDVLAAKMGGFLHDIGKAVDHEIEGSHALIGRDIAKKYGLSPKVVNAIEAHHEESEYLFPEAMVVQAADAISAARPGARRETVATYIKRLQDLENLASSFPGVEKCYAIQAGREVRVMVRPNEIDDMAAIKLSHDIARKIEQELAYPGTIKVNVLREMRAVEIAR